MLASPGGNQQGWKGLETVVRLDATWGDDAGNSTGMDKGCTSGPPMAEYPDPGARLCCKATNTRQGKGLTVTPTCHRSPPCTDQ
ncbi:hypothetical protein WISP_88224 [Willisornis vidua]|uniref:Uncharacterized protein n=1 Tax=Willisornis vidua TaxID=1566151 RepID=A0ABQ9D717_9PASS|nr:hypothetical protein WISP_88224 [Willisornis vidua]